MRHRSENKKIFYQQDVKCNGNRHVVTVSGNGQLHIQHTKENIKQEEIVVAMGGAPCPCVQILLDWRAGDNHRLHKYNMSDVFQFFHYNKDSLRLVRTRHKHLKNVNFTKVNTRDELFTELDNLCKQCGLKLGLVHADERFTAQTVSLQSLTDPKSIVDKCQINLPLVHRSGNGLVYVDSYSGLHPKLSRSPKNFPVWLYVTCMANVVLKQMTVDVYNKRKDDQCQMLSKLRKQIFGKKKSSPIEVDVRNNEIYIRNQGQFQDNNISLTTMMLKRLATMLKYTEERRKNEDEYAKTREKVKVVTTYP